MPKIADGAIKNNIFFILLEGGLSSCYNATRCGVPELVAGSGLLIRRVETIAGSSPAATA